jgi:hypothetical protein
MRFGWNFSSRGQVGRFVEEDAPVVGGHEATPRRWRRVDERPLRRIAQERAGNRGSALLIGFTAFHLRRATLIFVRPFELVILCGFTKELFDLWRRVIRRRRIDPYDAVVRAQLKSWSKSQPRNAVRVDADQVQPIRRHVQHELLDGFPVTAFEQRCFATLLGQKVCGYDRQGPARGRDHGGHGRRGCFMPSL